MIPTTHLPLVPKLCLGTTSRLAGVLVAALSSFVMTGCGDSGRAGVQGTVTLDGAQVERSSRLTVYGCNCYHSVASQFTRSIPEAR